MSEQQLQTCMPDLMADVVQQRTPAIVTFGEGGEVSDVFGDIAYYADTGCELTDLLANLLVGWQEGGALYAEVQMPSGKYADVRVVSEGALRHVVLLDVTAAANERREVLQSSHEAAMTERRRRSDLERRLASAAPPPEASDEAGAALLAFVTGRMRARVDEIAGHAQMLARGFDMPGHKAQSIACIQRASAHLQAWNEASIALLDAAAYPVEQEPVDLPRIAREMERRFGFGAQQPPAIFFVKSSWCDFTGLGLDRLRVQQILQCLASAQLEAGCAVVEVVLSGDRKGFVAELRPITPAKGSDVVVAALWERDVRCLVAKRRITEMGGTYESLEPMGAGVRVVIPMKPLSGERRPGMVATVLMAVAGEQLRARVLEVLVGAGVEVREYYDLAVLQHDAASCGNALIILGGRFAGTDGSMADDCLRTSGVRHRVLLLQPADAAGAVDCPRDGRTMAVDADADDSILRAAIKEGLAI